MGWNQTSKCQPWPSVWTPKGELRVAFDSTQIVSELHTARLGQLALASHRRVLTSGMEQTLRTFEEHFETSWWQTLNRSEEHTSELQSLMRNTYAVFC